MKKHLRIMIPLFCIVLSGCSVVMATRQPTYKNLNVLNKGTPRAKVVTELGAPLVAEIRDGKKVDIFSFKQGYSMGNKTSRALFHAAADVWTLGLWEVFGTPAEMIANGKVMKMEVYYDTNDTVEKVVTLEEPKKESSLEAQPKEETKVKKEPTTNFGPRTKN
jgi:outer membrane protein assembly factor BamE (lipoprotein component of BamABCDE complex)